MLIEELVEGKEKLSELAKTNVPFVVKYLIPGACHASGKPTHVIKDTINEDQYICQKCFPTNQSAFVVDNTTEEATVNKEELDIHDSVVSAVEQQMKVRIGSAKDLLKKLNLPDILEN